MSKSIFISHVYEDRQSINAIERWAKQGELGNAVVVYESEDLRNQGAEVISNHIKKKIEGAAVVFVLIGQDTHNHDWITKEVEYANSFYKKIIPIRIPGTTGAIPPILKNKTEVAFTPTAIKNVL